MNNGYSNTVEELKAKLQYHYKEIAQLNQRLLATQQINKNKQNQTSEQTNKQTGQTILSKESNLLISDDGAIKSLVKSRRLPSNLNNLEEFDC